MISLMRNSFVGTIGSLAEGCCCVMSFSRCRCILRCLQNVLGHCVSVGKYTLLFW